MLREAVAVTGCGTEQILELFTDTLRGGQTYLRGCCKVPASTVSATELVPNKHLFLLPISFPFIVVNKQVYFLMEKKAIVA